MIPIPTLQAITTKLGSAPISYISRATSTTNTITTMPSHQTGDLLLMHWHVLGNNVSPTLPSGWTSIADNILSDGRSGMAYKFAVSSSEVSGTWTNASNLICQVYRGVGSYGALATIEATSSNVNYPALTLQNQDNTSWVIGFVARLSTTDAIGNPPTGMTFRSSLTDTQSRSAGHDTNGTVNSWPSTNVTVASFESYRTYVLEIKKAA